MKNQHTIKPLAAGLAALLAIVCLLLAAGSARAAGNLLANGDFNAGNTGEWTTWAWGGGWSNFEIAGWGSPGGTTHIAVGAAGNGGAGIYQEIGGAAGVEYTLTVLSGADAWWLPTGRMEMFFLDGSTNLFPSNVISSVTQLTVDPAVYGVTNLDIAHPWSNYTMVATSPVGTVKVKVEFSSNESSFDTNNPYVATGSVGFDDASLTAPIEPPVISDVFPNGLLLPTNTLSFTASSAAGITNVSVLLNGVDVSASLVTNGPLTSLSVSYTSLESNTTYNAVITVTDADGLNAFTTVDFDTIDPIFLWEGEDFDYGGGLYINNPTPSDTPMAGSYAGLLGTEGVDLHDYSANGTQDYRSNNPPSMAIETTGDGIRQKFLDAGASDYNVGWFDGAPGLDWGLFTDGIEGYDAGEWVNYTRDFPAGTYNVYARLANGNGGTAAIPLSKVVSGMGTSSQTTEDLGVFSFPAVGWGAYAYVPLTDEFGNLVQVALSGTTTLRVTAGSGGNLNFFMLLPVDTEQPTITGVYPDGATLLQGTNELTFTASSASHSIAQSNVVVTLNGVDLSGSLSFSGTTSSWNVSGPVQLGVTNYTAVISVTDDVGNSHSVTVYFDTFDPTGFVVEGEDFDYGGGLFIDNPVITSNAAPDSYLDPPLSSARSSVPLWDSYVGEPTPTNAYGLTRYRSTDTIKTAVNEDTPLQKLVDAQATNAWAFSYHAGWLLSNSWLNYTRTYPAGDFNVYARLATVLQGFSLPLEDVTGGTTNLLGNFEGNGRNFGLFDWIPLMDGGVLAKVTLGGVTTLRFNTPQGEVNPNNLLFVPAVTLPEELQWSYAGGTLTLSWNDPAFKLQSQTNAPGAGISAGWSDYPGGATSPVNVSVDPSEGSVFYQLSD